MQTIKNQLILFRGNGILVGKMAFWSGRWPFGREDGILLGKIGILGVGMDIVAVRMGILVGEIGILGVRMDIVAVRMGILLGKMGILGGEMGILAGEGGV